MAGSVQSVDRSLDLLECLARAQGPVGIGELVEATGLPQGTVHRLLSTLEQRGYVRRNAARKYALGTAALRLADATQRRLVGGARQYLSELVALSGETANLAMLEGDEVVYVAQVSSPHTLRMFAEVGRHVPVHSTAVGKVLLAGMPRHRAVSLLERAGLDAVTPRTITRLSDFTAELDAVAAQGWAIDEEEQEMGVRCVAVPVGGSDSPLAALSISGPAERFRGAATEGLLAQMQRVARSFNS